jgi:DNA polymerase III subunit epsilon
MIETVLIVDTETSGLSPEKDSVIEIGAVWWSLRFRCVLATWSELCQAPSNEAQFVNRIDPSALFYGLTFDQACEGLRGRAARADALIVHRASFDSAFLPKDLGKPWICSKFDIEWPLSKPGSSLAEVAIAHDVPIVNAHRALADCLLLAQCFERVAMLAQLQPETVKGVGSLLERAMLPRVKIAAVGLSYEKRQLAKDAGFQWESDMKLWTKRVVETEAQAFKFKVEVIG